MKNGTTRVISGIHGSRKISFLPIKNLRPTTDRIRETLFNWLQNSIAGSYCLDAFSGSGSLGIEALSRGASSVKFIEKNKAQCSHLQKELSNLKIDIEAINADFFAWAKSQNEQFDVIFLDPPFLENFWQRSFDTIASNNIIKMNGHVYLEHPSNIEMSYANCWKLIKSETYGRVSFNLLQKVT